MDFRAKPKQEKQPKKIKKTVDKKIVVKKEKPTKTEPVYIQPLVQDLSDILNRLSGLENQIIELNQLKQSKDLALQAWKGFRKSLKKLCDKKHVDRVTTLAVLDTFFGVIDG